MVNPLYLLLILPGLLGWYAQKRVRDVYERYSEETNRKNASGMDIARALLADHGLGDIAVERVSGHLTDHYDPQKKALRLTDAVANGRSVTAMGIVAHEVGHAIQDTQGYRCKQMRTWMARRVGVLAQSSSFIFIGGMLFGNPLLMGLGAVLLFAMLVFSMVTLPVERDASRRALRSLEQAGLTTGEEKKGVQKVLRGAAMTYLANISQRLGTFLFFVALIGSAGRVG